MCILQLHFIITLRYYFKNKCNNEDRKWIRNTRGILEGAFGAVAITLKSAQIWAVSRGTKIGFTASKLKRYNQF